MGATWAQCSNYGNALNVAGETFASGYAIVLGECGIQLKQTFGSSEEPTRKPEDQGWAGPGPVVLGYGSWSWYSKKCPGLLRTDWVNEKTGSVTGRVSSGTGKLSSI